MKASTEKCFNCFTDLLSCSTYWECEKCFPALNFMPITLQVLKEWTVSMMAKNEKNVF